MDNTLDNLCVCFSGLDRDEAIEFISYVISDLDNNELLIDLLEGLDSTPFNILKSSVLQVSKR